MPTQIDRRHMFCQTFGLVQLNKTQEKVDLKKVKRFSVNWHDNHTRCLSETLDKLN